MKKLEYRLGKVEIDRKNFEYFGGNSRESKHRFLAVGNGSVIYGYVAPFGHVKMIKVFGIESARVLGGTCLYRNKEGDLVLDSLSLNYGSVPSAVACEFAKLIQEELKKVGLKGKKAVVKTKRDLSHRWEQYGYEDEDERALGKSKTNK